MTVRIAIRELGDPGPSRIGSPSEPDCAGKRMAEGDAKIVWIDLASGRSVPLPDHVRAKLDDTGR